jgi:hypothetical protein
MVAQMNSHSSHRESGGKKLLTVSEIVGAFGGKRK